MHYLQTTEKHWKDHTTIPQDAIDHDNRDRDAIVATEAIVSEIVNCLFLPTDNGFDSSFLPLFCP